MLAVVPFLALACSGTTAPSGAVRVVRGDTTTTSLEVLPSPPSVAAPPSSPPACQSGTITEVADLYARPEPLCMTVGARLALSWSGASSPGVPFSSDDRVVRLVSTTRHQNATTALYVARAVGTVTLEADSVVTCPGEATQRYCPSTTTVYWTQPIRVVRQ